jgi:hypothetical protein
MSRSPPRLSLHQTGSLREKIQRLIIFLIAALPLCEQYFPQREQKYYILLFLTLLHHYRVIIMAISTEKEAALLERMNELDVKEEDFKETFIRSSGPGGQKVNKTATCVYLIHTPTGLSVKCQQERSQTLNRFLARRLLLDRIERVREGILKSEQAAIEKIRRQKRRRSKRAKEKILADKKRVAEKKSLRAKPDINGAD